MKYYKDMYLYTGMKKQVCLDFKIGGGVYMRISSDGLEVINSLHNGAFTKYIPNKYIVGVDII